jgi:hypothetical protein
VQHLRLLPSSNVEGEDEAGGFTAWHALNATGQQVRQTPALWLIEQIFDRHSPVSGQSKFANSRPLGLSPKRIAI